jgi:hypothetical protein
MGIALVCGSAAFLLREILLFCGANTGATIIALGFGIFTFLSAVESVK